jgi:hypothetical protein
MNSHRRPTLPTTPLRTFPEGSAFWELSCYAEGQCEAISLAQAFHDGQFGVAARLGTVLSLLYRMACCHWGCHGKEHVFEFLAGRTCTSALATFRLMGFGYYDEALALSRNIAEIGNLVHLFFEDSTHVRLWLDLPDKERRQRYSPLGVRSALEKLGSVVPTDQDQYSWLCAVGTHVTPRTIPQGHNQERRPILGAAFQLDGWNTSLAALTWSVCTVSGPIAKLSILDRAHSERLLEETIALVQVL